MYFVEVKYRSSNEYGSGLEYITPSKLKQMAYAASRWVAEHTWPGEYTLSAIEVGGDQFEIADFVESIEIG
jgi:Holliday junction resolvase-like predicted endonuclease